MAEAKYPRDLQTTVFGVATALKRNPQIGPAGPHLIIPYSLDANDMRFVNPQGLGAAMNSSPISRTALTCCMPNATLRRVPTRLQIAQHWHAHLSHLAGNAFDTGS